MRSPRRGHIHFPGRLHKRFPMKLTYLVPTAIALSANAANIKDEPC
jgi:hypothetical protein